MTQLRKRMLEELQRRNYSKATTRGYIGAVERNRIAPLQSAGPYKLLIAFRRRVVEVLIEGKVDPLCLGSSDKRRVAEDLCSELYLGTMKLFRSF